MRGLLFVVCGLAACSLAAPPSNATRIDVLVPNGTAYFCIKIPTLFQTHAGTLLALGEARRDSCSDSAWTDIVIRRSHDNGLTWSPLSIVFTNSTADKTNTIGNAAPVQISRSKRILLPFCRNNVEVLLMYSDDDGMTWSQPSLIPNVVHPNWKWVGLGPPGAIELLSGRILVPAYHTTILHGDGQLSVGHSMYSDDEGLTWSLGADYGQHHWSNECQMVEIAPNRILVNSRTLRSYRYQAISHDGGETFDEGGLVYDLREPIDGCEGSLVRDKNTNITYYSGPQSEGLIHLYRSHVTVFASRDDGESYEEYFSVDQGPSGYSSMVVLQNGAGLAVLYERASRNEIVQTAEQISLKVLPLAA